MTPRPVGIVVQNRWREAATDLGEDWRPSKTVSIIVPTYNNPPGLDLVLASLAAQDYPQELTEVIIVDDGSEPAITLPVLRPPSTRLVRAQNGWGRANAVHEGVLQSAGEIIMQLDSDLVLDRSHVTSHLKVHDQLHWAATKGEIIFVDAWPDDPVLIHQAVHDGRLKSVFHEAKHEPQWVERIYLSTDDLNDGNERIFSVLTGATCSMSRALYDAAGGMRTDLRLGEDTELAYRLAQRGAVFVPCRESPAFHLGMSNVHLRAEDVKDYNRPFYAQEIPLISEARTPTGRQWSVPLILATVQIDESTAYLARACVDRILSSVAEDLAVDLIGPWSLLTANRRDVMSDPLRELHAVAQWYQQESRVRLVAERAPSAFPSPFEIDIPVHVGVNRTTIGYLLRALRKNRAGVATLPIHFETTSEPIRMWRTAAVERARAYWPDQPGHTRAGDVWGSLDVPVVKTHDLRKPANLGARINWHRDNVEVRRLRAEVRRLKSAPKPSLIRRFVRRIKRKS